MDNSQKNEEDNNKENTLSTNHIKQLKNLNFFELVKSEELSDKKEALDILTKIFNDIDSIIDKYEILIKISKEIFPLILNISIPSFSHTKNIKNIELYIFTGKFLLQFLFNKEYVLDFSDFQETKNKKISLSYIS